MKIAQIKLPFALDDHNNLVHIADAMRGVEFHYLCPSCRSQLVSVKGDINQHHFRHLSPIECKGGLESAIHLAAKKVICEEKQITLPELERRVLATESRGKEHTKREIVVQDEIVIEFDSVQEEKLLDEMRYDLLADAGKTPLIIEICYTHKVDDQKITKIVEVNKSAVELSLSDLTPEDVKNMELFRSFIKDPKRTKWLHNVRGQFVVRKLEDELANEIRAQEEKYKAEEIIKQRKAQREKDELLRAVKGLKMLQSIG